LELYQYVISTIKLGVYGDEGIIWRSIVNETMRPRPRKILEGARPRPRPRSKKPVMRPRPKTTRPKPRHA